MTGDKREGNKYYANEWPGNSEPVVEQAKRGEEKVPALSQPRVNNAPKPT